jgi:hypothetical protein
MPPVGRNTEEDACVFNEIYSMVILVLRRMLKIDFNNFLMVV